VAIGKQGSADWVVDGGVSGVEWAGEISSGVCAGESAALLGDEQCAGGGIGVGGGGVGGDAGTAEQASSVCRGLYDYCFLMFVSLFRFDLEAQFCKEKHDARGVSPI
jgi:hypothetical protein